ncbi:MAG: (Fe-S)-binding protein [Alphaproteobacteria bacterium]|nr:(Fe-S)-binding protein [Alphaproteobacteria bacterium]
MMNEPPDDRAQEGRVALFLTCLVELMRPDIGQAARKLLEAGGCDVVIPRRQTCCGQPNFNGGDRNGARRLAKSTIKALAGFDHVVVPSGSCAAMISRHYPELFADDDRWRARAHELAGRTVELTSFLNQNNLFAGGKLDAATLSYHDSCSGLRELGIKHQPRALLSRIEGVEVKELEEPEVCCGFGGTFCVKYPQISERMADNKAADTAEAGGDYLVMGDLGCLLHLEGVMHRKDADVELRHIAEILADSLAKETRHEG